MPDKQIHPVSDRPFDRKILSKAKRTVENYRFAFWREHGRYIGQCVEMDTMGTGDTIEQCVAEAKELARISHQRVRLRRGESSDSVFWHDCYLSPRQRGETSFPARFSVERTGVATNFRSTSG